MKNRLVGWVAWSVLAGTLGCGEGDAAAPPNDGSPSVASDRGPDTDAALDATLDADSGGHARLNLLVTDPYLGHNLFDGQDFAALDADGDDLAVLAPGTPEGTRLARQFIRHDFWFLLNVRANATGEN